MALFGGARAGSLAAFLGAETQGERLTRLQADLQEQAQQRAQQAQTGALTAGVTALGQAEPFSPLADPAARQGELVGLLSQGGPLGMQAGSELLAQQQAVPIAPEPISQFDALKTQKAQQDLVNAQLETEKRQLGLTEQAITLRNLQAYGGLPPAQHGAQMRTIGEFGTGMNNVEDIRTLNNQFGRAAIPGAVKGKYDALRTITFNTLRQLTDAGALQKPDLELFESLLPDFGAFSSLSFEQREAQLQELQRQIQIRTQTWVDTTPNAVMPQVSGRSVPEILDEPAPPPGSEPVSGEAALNVGQQFLQGTGLSAIPEFVEETVRPGVEAFQGLLRGE